MPYTLLCNVQLRLEFIPQRVIAQIMYGDTMETAFISWSPCNMESEQNIFHQLQLVPQQIIMQLEIMCGDAVVTAYIYWCPANSVHAEAFYVMEEPLHGQFNITLHLLNSD